MGSLQREFQHLRVQLIKQRDALLREVNTCRAKGSSSGQSSARISPPVTI